MTGLVLDASIAVSWCLEEVQGSYAKSVLRAIADGIEVHVPSIWPLEVTNALLRAVRRQRITREHLFEYLSQLEFLGPVVDAERVHERAFGDVLRLAERHQLTTYDASYLELAARLGVLIATADANLIQAARAMQVPVFQPAGGGGESA